MNYTALSIGTLVIILFSWFYSIKHKRYHGIPRFFAFESIFILILLNLKVWFHDPASVKQIISWILLIFSAYAGLEGIILLKGRGKSGANFEETTVLVKSGLYRYIRHPLYMSLFLLGTGVMMKDPGPVQLTAAIVNFLAVYVTSRVEEKEMVEKFGDEYVAYIRETKMFVPFLI